MTTEEADGEATLGVRHEHVWTTVTARPALQSAHDTMRWDVDKSRIIAVDVCDVCGEHRDDSVQECTETDCHAHSICERPHR